MTSTYQSLYPREPDLWLSDNLQLESSYWTLWPKNSFWMETFPTLNFHLTENKGAICSQSINVQAGDVLKFVMGKNAMDQQVKLILIVSGQNVSQMFLPTNFELGNESNIHIRSLQFLAQIDLGCFCRKLFSLCLNDVDVVYSFQVTCFVILANFCH